MSDKIRATAGILLAVMAVLLALSGLLPVREKETFTLESRGTGEVRLSAIPTVSESDLVNTGDLFELTELPGVGETIAALLMDEREAHGLFVYPEDLTAVKGIGPKKLEQIRPFLITGTNESGDE